MGQQVGEQRAGLPDGPARRAARLLPRATCWPAPSGWPRRSAPNGVAVDAAGLLTGRAGLLGLTRGGRVSAGGATRLLAARDGWCAITLSRPDDVAAVPALLQVDDGARRPVADAAALGRNTSGVRDHRAGGSARHPGGRAWARLRAAPPRVRAAGAPGRRRARVGRPAGGRPVVDVGGPAVRAAAGARREQPSSKSKARAARTAPEHGNRAFFDWINGEKLSYCVDFDSQADELRELLAVADIVIEGSRPAALARRRLGPDDIAPRAGPNLVAHHRI